MKIGKKIKSSYASLCRLLNFFILGRYLVEIETPQFVGNGEDFYMLRQIGWLYLSTLTFRHDKQRGGNHDVKFHSEEDAFNAIVRWL